MSIFEPALSMVLSHEGALEENAADSAGITNHGISLKFYRSRIKPDATVDDIKNLTVNQAASIYHDLFWKRAPYEEIESQMICNRVFDLSVNIGISHAIGCLQKAVNSRTSSHLVIDGTLGTKTLEAVNSAPQQELYDSLINQATLYYKEIVQNHPQNKLFYDGWVRRLNN